MMRQSRFSGIQTNGKAAYKARTLYALYNPASMFDDVIL
jgi:hypothetical protein